LTHRTRRSLLPLLAASAFLCLLAALGGNRLLWWTGSLMDASTPPRKADLILVLGGDWTGGRILRAGELVRQGIAPKVFVSGAAVYFGRPEFDLQIDYAVSRGYSRDSFTGVQLPNLSTADEAATELRIFRRMGVRRLLIVTHPWHTARALRIFRRSAPDMEIRATGIEDRHWHGGYWWTDREGRKIWLLEAAKTAADLLTHIIH